jgi:site-specific recombinase XerD
MQSNEGAPVARVRLLDQVRQALAVRHYSPKTIAAYVAWIRRFIVFHERRHPLAMGQSEVSAFLSSLAVDDDVRASTQNQALAALLFLYREVLERELVVTGLVHAKRPTSLPPVGRPPDGLER